jgi:hypothetical protein
MVGAKRSPFGFDQIRSLDVTSSELHGILRSEVKTTMRCYFAESLRFSCLSNRWPFRCWLKFASQFNTMPSQTKRFHGHPLLRELKDLHTTESTLERQYVRLQRTKKPRQAAIGQFVTELVRLKLRLEGLNRTLNATG